MLPPIFPADGWGSRRWQQPGHCPTQHTASAGQPATAAHSHSLMRWNPVALTHNMHRHRDKERAFSSYTGKRVHAALLCKSSLAVYELRLVWHGQGRDQLSPNSGAKQGHIGRNCFPAVGNYLSAWPRLLVTDPAFSSTTTCPLSVTCLSEKNGTGNVLHW